MEQFNILTVSIFPELNNIFNLNPVLKKTASIWGDQEKLILKAAWKNKVTGITKNILKKEERNEKGSLPTKQSDITKPSNINHVFW